MRKITIEIDEEIFNFLQKQATPFVDSPNDVLRRILLSNGKNTNNDVSAAFTRKSGVSLPVLPGGVPKALEHTLQVAYLVRFAKMSRSNATNYLANLHRVAPQTIIDKYCRQLDLTAYEFDQLLQSEDLKSLKELLHKKHPRFYKTINEYLTYNGGSLTTK
ncbi:hypothetical protein [Syntrophotalea acetylenica]|uniref:Uncharacterized protein n=1 Tax=Syntrophotalea acetylenica TaxID=29542 RepID=A0A1L3GEK9_SYNAC|nr:hypothetical protein [Syntrophotalea acetylenica]APG24347.1 hypothetical protein A7E75_04335 [Syntrophotalea acetylenica]APG44928.1 hypothetical protein A6070_12970 [Syntrophotalea acetylenica]